MPDLAQNIFCLLFLFRLKQIIHGSTFVERQLVERNRAQLLSFNNFQRVERDISAFNIMIHKQLQHLLLDRC